jgi:DDE superfamily endonuclease
MEGTADVPYQIADAHLPEEVSVFDAATALDTAMHMADPQLTMVELLVRHGLLPREHLPQIEINSSGKKKDNTVKNVLLVNALLTILFLSDTYGGRTHDLRIAEATPSPLPAGSGLLQDLGFLSCTLPDVAILMPTKKPRGEELSLEQQLTNQALHQRRLRIEHVNSSVKRCRIVKDRIRLWKQGVRDLVMELCCALHNFRVRLHPWLPMI